MHLHSHQTTKVEEDCLQGVEDMEWDIVVRHIEDRTGIDERIESVSRLAPVL
jgi:hypothetical protein